MCLRGDFQPALVLALCGVVLATLGAAAQTIHFPQDERRAEAQLNPDHVRAYLRYLSSDLLEGRGTGERGGELAAAYIANQFELDGLQPGGDHGTYLQYVPLIGIDTLPSSHLVIAGHGQHFPLQFLADTAGTDETQQAHSQFSAPMVFVGYGIHAPEFQWDDYKGVDLHGKVAVMLVNEPPSRDPHFFNGPALTYYGRWTYKFEEAARRGAVACLLVHDTAMASYGWDVVRSSWSGRRAFAERAPHQPKLHYAGWITEAKATAIFAASGLNLKAEMKAAQSRDFHPVVMGMTAAGDITSDVTKLHGTWNVVGLWPGRDPRLGKQAVLLTAHYDHLGIHPGEKGDNIYNGAVDNGSGTADLLELAHAVSSSGARTKRTLVFAAVTGEEQGLLGSQYYGEHPVIPAAETSLDLNTDAILQLGRTRDINLEGARRTTIFPAVQEILRQHHLRLEQVVHKGAGEYYRSDHFSLARVGIPAFSMNLGKDYFGRPAGWGQQQEEDYNDHRYHQASDEFDPRWTYSGDIELMRIEMEIAWVAGTQAGLVQWEPGDEFASLRQNSAAARN